MEQIRTAGGLGGEKLVPGKIESEIFFFGLVLNTKMSNIEIAECQSQNFKNNSDKREKNTYPFEKKKCLLYVSLKILWS